MIRRHEAWKLSIWDSRSSVRIQDSHPYSRTLNTNEFKSRASVIEAEPDFEHHILWRIFRDQSEQQPIISLLFSARECDRTGSRERICRSRNQP